MIDILDKHINAQVETYKNSRLMANQRHKDKRQLGIFLWKEDKEHLEKKSVSYHATQTDLVRAALLNFDTLTEQEQKSWVNKIQLDY